MKSLQTAFVLVVLSNFLNAAEIIKTDKPHPSYLIPATNEIVQEFADLLAVIAIAASDNQITQKEAERIRARWEELKSVTETFVACCEEGNFSSLKERPPTLSAHK